MKIDNLRPGQYLPTGQELPQATNDSAKGTRTPKSISSDSIELSNNTILARDIASPDEVVSESPLLTPERLAEIRARVGRGFYNSESSLSQSADQIVESFKGSSK